MSAMYRLTVTSMAVRWQLSGDMVCGQAAAEGGLPSTVAVSCNIIVYLQQANKGGNILTGV